MHKKINIIFHHPLPLNENAKSASGIRPVKMLKAFQELGCEVDLVTGFADERKHCINKIKENINSGKKYDLVYSESSTMPTILTDPHHLPLHPFLDWHFFKFCKKNEIPIGLFYRDIYWLFDNYGKDLNPIKKTVAKLSYRFDLWVYQKTLSLLYLPSLAMRKYIPGVSSSIFSALPPGHSFAKESDLQKHEALITPLKLFYVGGMSEHYQMHRLFDAVRGLRTVELTICTRDVEWDKVRNEYGHLPENINIVHASGEEMESKLSQADIAMLFVKPHEYWEFASPVKLYEYIGFRKPIIASEGTLAGQFVHDNHIGWSVPYESMALKNLLIKITNDISLLAPVCQQVKYIAPRHLWQSRASQVIQDLVK